MSASRTADLARSNTAPRIARLPSTGTVIAVGGLFALLFVALFGERLAPHESIYFVLEHGQDPRPYDPGLVFPFGSDILGRDLFSLVLAGARATLTIVLLAGCARVFAGIAVAAIGNRWRPARIATEAVADFASAVPATLVALLLVKVFVRSADTSVIVFIGALLLTGWAGPYRVIRAELDRLAHAPFTGCKLERHVSLTVEVRADVDECLICPSVRTGDARGVHEERVASERKARRFPRADTGRLRRHGGEHRPGLLVGRVERHSDDIVPERVADLPQLRLDLFDITVAVCAYQNVAGYGRPHECCIDPVADRQEML